MMRKKIVSLCMALALCLGLLPATALAAGEDAPNNLYVGNQNVKSGEDTTYWTTNDSGALDKSNENADWTVRYNPNTATLTLKSATIKPTSNIGTSAVIYAQSNSQSAVSLTIELDGRNTIECDSAFYGIYVDAEMSNDSYGTDASLTITGNGSLEVSGSFNGIVVKSGSGNASLTINNASVVAKTTQTHSGYAGVYVQSSTKATGSPQLSLAVNGGSLTTSASEGNDGIQFYVGSSEATGATTSLTVSDNAIVDARNGGISASRILETLPTPTPTGDNSSGIVFDGNTGTVYGKVELQEDLEIGEGESLTLAENASLSAGGHNVIVDGGTVDDSIKNSLGDKVKYAPTITTTNLPTGTVGTSYNQTLAATGSDTITWSIERGSLPAGLSLNESTGEITGTPTAEGSSAFTVKAENSYGSDSEELSITINEPATISVTGVSLDQSALTLTEDGTAQLTATVEPANATNKDVTWEISDTSVATVDANGKVTAVAVGSATITVKTQDGEKTASCTVTVKEAPHVHTTTKTAAKPATCTEAGNTAYWYCSGCHKYFADEAGTEETTLADTVIPATGHTFRGGWCAVCGARDPNYVPPANPNYRVDVTATEGGAVTKNPAAAKAGETVTLTPTPEEGYEVGNVTVTDRFGDAVEVTENADGTYTFTMPNGQVRVEVTFVEATPEPLPFTDVNEGDWFHDAVRYVYDNGLMDGVGDGQFAPNATTNRAMVVTILHRLAGEPAVAGDVGFTDVEPGLWYTDAVAWAAQKGIVNGISETEFAPSGDLTREQLATILYRYAESMGYDVSASVDLSGFPDAGDIQSYATQALSWAVAEGLLQGFEDDSLQPGGTATRAQIATILMRFLAAAPTA